MTSLTVAFLGALAGLGLLVCALAFRPKPPKSEAPKQERGQAALRRFRARGTRAEARRALAGRSLQIALAGGFAVAGWLVTGWPVAAMLGAVAGFVGPQVMQAPRARRAVADEIEAYSQWAEQVRDLVRASGSLFEAVTLSADNAPARLRPAVVNMATVARTLGLPRALDWFAAEMRSPFADRIVLGMKIAWDSGARVTEAFDSAARGMRNEVEMRRRNEVANSRAWTQVMAILFVTFVSVSFMFVFNRGFFDPFGTLIGQVVLLGVGVLIFGNVFWVLKLSASNLPSRLLADEPGGVAAAAPAVAGDGA
ncbi:MAG: type II secretion system F family protein [bacterium]|nr:type II secretion system F family protein [bacterium]